MPGKERERREDPKTKEISKRLLKDSRKIKMGQKEAQAPWAELGRRAIRRWSDVLGKDSQFLVTVSKRRAPYLIAYGRAYTARESLELYERLEKKHMVHSWYPLTNQEVLDFHSNILGARKGLNIERSKVVYPKFEPGVRFSPSSLH